VFLSITTKKDKLMKKYLLSTAVAAAVMVSGNVMAEGFRVNEQGTEIQKAFSNAAVSDRASAAYWNPAALVQLDGMQIATNLHGLLINTKLKDKGSKDLQGVLTSGLKDKKNPFDLAVVPNLYLSYEVAKDWRIGLAVNSTYGLKNEYAADQFNLFDAEKSDLFTLNVAPVVAYKFNDYISVGAGLDITYMNAELVNHPFILRSGKLTIKGKDFAFGGHAGIFVKPMDELKLGLSYHSRMKYVLEGTSSSKDPLLLSLLTGGAVSGLSVDDTATFYTPDMITASVEAKVMKDLKLSAMVRYVVWSVFDKIDFKVLPDKDFKYEDAMSFSVGMDYKLMDNIDVKAGYMYEDTPTTKAHRTSSVPDSVRHWATLGMTYHFNKDVSVDMAYAHVFYEDAEIDRVEGASRLYADVKGHADIVSVGLNMKF
jgi:long-chain fatty acid transport protein